MATVALSGIITPTNVVTTTSTSTLTNKTLSSPTITGVSTFAAGTAALPALTTTGDTNTGIFFPAADTIAFTEGGTECGRFNSSGNLQTIGTISVGNATPSTSGAGITFPADQSILGGSSNANTLDDYEEGTWTPTLESTGGGTIASGTYTRRTGNYVKVGKLVTVQWQLQVSSASALSAGSISITGLPFTCENTTLNRWRTFVLFWFQTGINCITIQAQISPNTSVVDLFPLSAAGTDNSPSNVTLTTIGNTGYVELAGNFSYTAA